MGEIGLILAADGQILVVSPSPDGVPRERFSVGAKIFEYFDAESAGVLRNCMELAAEQSAPNRCFAVCTSTSSEAVVFEARVVSLAAMGCVPWRFAIGLKSSRGQINVPYAEGGTIPEQTPRLTRDIRAVTHDLNNLLTTIISFAGFLKDDLPVRDPRREDVCEVLEAASKAVQLTDQLLAPDSDPDKDR